MKYVWYLLLILGLVAISAIVVNTQFTGNLLFTNPCGPKEVPRVVESYDNGVSVDIQCQSSGYTVVDCNFLARQCSSCQGPACVDYCGAYRVFCLGNQPTVYNTRSMVTA